jgi:peptidoglycan/LPS O-acetylase OafA/YrhL
MVLFGHLDHEVLDRKWLTITSFVPFEPVFWPGGVDIFFVLSGFIMMYISYDHFGSVHSAAKFLKRRLIRILPPYWFYTSVMVVAALVLTEYVDHPILKAGHLIASYFLFPVMNPYGGIYPFFIIGWTLEFEMLFYVIFSVGLLFRRPMGLPMIYGAIFALACSSLLRPSWAPLQFWTSPIIIEFALGMALGQLRIAGVRLPVWAGWLCAAVAIALMVALQGYGIAGTHWPLRWAWMGAPAFVLCTGMALQTEKGRPSGWMKWLVFGGDASYSLYLSHPFTINAVAVVTHRLGLASPQLYVLISFVAALAVAAACYVWLEKPVYGWLSKARLPTFRTARAVANG